MASFGQIHNRPRDGTQSVSGRLYKFALVLTVNEELARALLRSAMKGLNARNNSNADNREVLIGAFRRMYSLWSAKATEDPSIQRRCPADPRLFASSLARGPLAGNVHFAKFIATMPFQQRAALYLVYGEGASYDEAAEAVGLELLALMTLLARGHLALSQWLDHRGISDADVSPARERAA